MNLVSRHLTGLADFHGRENRQPFWLWVLISYGFQMVVGMIVMIPLMMGYFDALTPLMQRDPTYIDQHPEIAQQILMQAMLPMMRGVMIFSTIMALLFVALLVAAVVRRLHDSDRSGWWAAPVFAMQIAMPLIYAAIFPDFFAMVGKVRPNTPPAEMQAMMAPMMQSMGLLSLFGMLSFVLTIVLIVFLCLPGTPGPNRFGRDPIFDF